MVDHGMTPAGAQWRPYTTGIAPTELSVLLGRVTLLGKVNAVCSELVLHKDLAFALQKDVKAAKRERTTAEKAAQWDALTT